MVFANSLDVTGNNTDATSYLTDSFSASPNRLVLAWVYSICATAPNTPTLSGSGLTWVEVDNVTNGSVRKLTLFRAMSSTPPSGGGVTIDFGGQTQTGCAWTIVEYGNVDTTGSDGANAVVQAVTGSDPTNTTSLSITLASFASANNATAGGFGIPLNNSSFPAEGSGFTLTGRRAQGSPNLSIMSEFRSDNDTTVDASWGASTVPSLGIAVELKFVDEGSPMPTHSKSPGISSASAVIPRPEGLAVGDLMFAHVSHKFITSGNITAPANWNLINETTSTLVRVGLWWKVADSGDVSATDFTFTNAGSGSTMGVIVRVPSYNTLDPVGENNNGAGTSATVTTSGITPEDANSLILFFIGTGNDVTVSGHALATDDITWAEQYDYITDVGSDCSAALAYGVRPQITATGNATATIASTNYVAHIVAVRTAITFSAKQASAFLIFFP